MKNFLDISNRLKTALSIPTNKELANILGLSETAFSERKKRNAFPVKELEALAGKRPDLNLDIEYILTGSSERFDREYSRFMFENQRRVRNVEIPTDFDIYPIPNNADRIMGLTLDEVELIGYFRKIKKKDNQKAILKVVRLAVYGSEI